VPSWYVRIPVLLIALIVTVHVARTASRRIEVAPSPLTDPSAS
jgi:hypothetical protein